MRLRAVDVRNWACIEALRLADLRDGVIVLHGPNRTGKSSLVQAIRSTLFDHFHDSQEATLLAAIPFKTKSTPQVAVEFEHAGKQYRVTKTFARTKEGSTTLEQIVSGSSTVLDRGKDATKKIRELIGVESSEAGVFQMLWLGQRDFQLPKPRDVDATLQEALEEVLGTLITGRDIAFKERLDKACERWFTVKTMQDKKQSPVTKLSADLTAAKLQNAEIEQQWAAAEAALRQYDDALAHQPELTRELQATEVELNRVQTDWQAVRERKARLELARKNLEQSDQLHANAMDRLREHDDAVEQCRLTSKTLDELQLELRAAEDKKIETERALVEARLAADAANHALEGHRRERAALDDRQRLISCVVQHQALSEKISQLEGLEIERRTLEESLVGPVAPSEKRINELRQMSDQAARLRAQLEAAEIHVTVRANKPIHLGITKDGESAASNDLDGETEKAWLVRQHAEIQLGDIASIRIGRGAENRDLESLARDLSDVEKTLNEALIEAQVDPADPASIDQLVARRLQHEEYARQLRNVRERIAQAAPMGLPALHSQLNQLQTERALILTRRLELRDWKPNQLELDRQHIEFESQEAKLISSVDSANNAVNVLTNTSAKANEATQKLRERIGTQTIQVARFKERIEREPHATLVAESTKAGEALNDAREKLKESTLTDAEHAMESQFESVRAAHLNRAERVRDNENRLAELRGQLSGAEGLHQKRIQAEQTVNDCSREVDRESLYAGAHKQLKELFEQIRQEQVRRTVGPINDRVIQWARLLGLNEYAGLEFGGQVLPQGLLPSDAPTDEAVAMERESYGTLEQLSLLIRLAVGGLLARNEATVAILDDPLAHADPGKHRKMLEILARAAKGEATGAHPTGPLQLIVLTCHADRFDYLKEAQQIDLARLIRRGS